MNSKISTMKSNISLKLLPLIIVGVAVLSTSFYSMSRLAQQAAVNKETTDAIRIAKKTFYNLVENDIKVLQVGITDFMTNQGFKDIFLENDREKLYQYGQDLFSKHKKMGVTHFYFIRKDGTVLSRIHNATKYDDKVNRATFIESKNTKDWGTGIELGKTAFALRVVHPYYNNGELIGYVEYGEEIDHFLHTMKEQTGFEYGIVVKKKYINSEKWDSVRSSKGLKNNYHDLKNHVIIESTMEDVDQFNEYAFDLEDLKHAQDEGRIFNQFELNNKAYVSGGFALYDASGANVGSVVVIQDISTVISAAKKQNLTTLLVALFGTIILCLIFIYLIRWIIVKPLSEVVRAATRVVGGDFNATADVRSKDEIGHLAKMLNSLSQVVANTGKELEDVNDQLDISERLRLDSEGKLNRIKQQIQQRRNQNKRQ